MHYVEITLVPLRFSGSGLAVMCDCGLDKDVWLPLSQFETPPEEGDRGVEGVYEVAEWMAKEKELI